MRAGGRGSRASAGSADRGRDAKHAAMIPSPRRGRPRPAGQRMDGRRPPPTATRSMQRGPSTTGDHPRAARPVRADDVRPRRRPRGRARATVLTALREPRRQPTASPLDGAGDLRRAGDAAAQAWLAAALADARPGDAVLSEEASATTPPPDRGPGLDHRPARRHPRVRASARGRRSPRRLRGPRRALDAATAGSPPAPSPSPPAALVLDSATVAPVDPDAARAVLAGARPCGSPPAAPARPSSSARLAEPRRRRARADGLERRQGRRAWSRDRRRIRPRRRPVRVGLGGAGGGRPRRRARRDPARRLAARLQPAGPVVARPRSSATPAVEAHCAACSPGRRRVSAPAR